MLTYFIVCKLSKLSMYWLEDVLARGFKPFAPQRNFTLKYTLQRLNIEAVLTENHEAIKLMVGS